LFSRKTRAIEYFFNPSYTGRKACAMRKTCPSITDLLAKLESFHGKQEPGWPTDPYLFLVWWHCGYPASDATCARGWESLSRKIGVEPGQILSASPAKLAGALQGSGMHPDLRAMRLKEIAARVQDEFGSDLRAALVGPVAKVRKTLKSFPGIGDPGADRILLFAGLAPVAAVPSNSPYVVERLLRGRESENYVLGYREAQRAMDAEVPEKFDTRVRAYLLLKRHGHEVCKRTNPKCSQCPVSASCAFFAENRSK
jgi:endonuclease III